MLHKVRTKCHKVLHTVCPYVVGRTTVRPQPCAIRAKLFLDTLDSTSKTKRRTYSEILAWGRANHRHAMSASRARHKALREASRPRQCDSCQHPIRAELAGWDWSWSCQACGATGLKPAEGSTWDARRNAASRKVLAAMGYVPKKRGK